jgi:hypothetical protein
MMDIVLATLACLLFGMGWWPCCCDEPGECFACWADEELDDFDEVQIVIAGFTTDCGNDGAHSCLNLNGTYVLQHDPATRGNCGATKVFAANVRWFNDGGGFCDNASEITVGYQHLQNSFRVDVFVVAERYIFDRSRPTARRNCCEDFSDTSIPFSSQEGIFLGCDPNDATATATVLTSSTCGS